METKSKNTETPIAQKAVKRTKPKLNLTDMILVKNGFAGRLIVHLPKAGYDVILNQFGDEDYIELAELKALRNGFPKYFINSWVVIDDPDAINFLSLDNVYKNSVSMEEMSEFFSLSTDDMKVKIDKMSDGQKKSLVYQILEKIETGELDSRNTISFLETELNTQLVEK